MSSVPRSKITEFVEAHIQDFHKTRLQSLLTLRLNDILKRKNPYLFKAKALETAQDLVKPILDAHLSSQEEGIFGGFLEQLALFVCRHAYSGRKSSSAGIDLDFEKDGVRYLVSVKSGPNWGNSGQIEKMKEDFRRAIRTLRTNQGRTRIVAINGCCYGRDNRPDKDEYLKYCGQRFWEFISGDPDLYIDLIEPLGRKAKRRNEEFLREYARVVNKFSMEFGREYCAPDGTILWKKLVQFNSGKCQSQIDLPPFIGPLAGRVLGGSSCVKSARVRRTQPV